MDTQQPKAYPKPRIVPSDAAAIALAPTPRPATSPVRTIGRLIAQTALLADSALRRESDAAEHRTTTKRRGPLSWRMSRHDPS